MSAPPRETLNGCWILDKTIGEWSMRGYLETMDVNELAIKAHEKGESDNDTFHTIELDYEKVRIVKRSRVNNDLVVELELGKPRIDMLPPGDRPKKSLAISNNLQHLQITSSLQTVNGMANVKDIKRLEKRPQEGKEDQTVMVQELTIVNHQSGRSNTTVRTFVPYSDVPPHLVEETTATAADEQEDTEMKDAN